jgi:hypothetical protein
MTYLSQQQQQQQQQQNRNKGSTMRTHKAAASLLFAVFAWAEASATLRDNMSENAVLSDADEGTTAHLLARQLSESTATMYSASLADAEAEWDEYQQAWRMLGFMIDCEDVSHWDDDYQSGSGDYVYSENGCRRYVLWAAYVDENYSGGGIGEYQYWDRSSNKWNSDPCSYAKDGDGRCAQMDCHLSDTEWSLLGIFKHRAPDDWMEQLFKHEGKCVWSDDEYSFMKNARKAWPTGCVLSDATTISGRPIYYALQPVQGGKMTMGLYTDDKCTQEYTGVNSSVENVVGNFLVDQDASGSGDGDSNMDYSGWSFSQAVNYWDTTMETFSFCQPCVAYDLNNVGFNGGTQGSSYGTYDCDNDNDNYDDDNGGQNDQCVEDDFDCYDDAGYTNVNQCMKFRAKTQMDTATIRDVMLAHRQGTLVTTMPLAGMENPHAGFFRTTGKFLGSLLYFAVAVLLFSYGVNYFRRGRKHMEWPAMKESLVYA